MRFQLLRICKLLLLFIGISTAVHGQTDKGIKKDTAARPLNFVDRMQEFAKKSAISSATDLQSDRAAQIQETTLVEIKKTLQQAKIFLRTGLDTVIVKRELLLIADHAKLAASGIFDHKKTNPTYRNIVATEKLMTVLLERCNLWKGKLDIQKQKLSGFKFQIDSLSNIKALFEFPKDSVKLSKYLQTLVVIAKEVSPIDSLIDKSALQIQTLRNQAHLQIYSLENSLDEIKLSQGQFTTHFFEQEFASIWKPEIATNSFGKSIAYSAKKTLLNLQFFSISNAGILILSLISLFLCYLFVLSLRKAYQKEIEGETLKDEYLILRFPLVSAIFMVSILSQFLFSTPPFIFSVIFWMISATSLTILLYGYISKFWMFAWISMASLLVFASLDNLILQPTLTERWLMLLLAALGIVIGACILKWGKREDLREKLIIYAIGLMVLLEICSFSLNLLGSYNLAKAFLVAGYVNVVIAIMFLWTLRLINQGLQLAFNLYASQEKNFFFMNFDRVGQRAPTLLYILLLVGWFILVGRNFPIYGFAVEPVRNFFFDQRAIGSYTFSISNLILFFFVVSMSVILSKVISFFALDKRTQARQQEGKRGLGSWILLIRITIIILGLFLAFAAVGIPVDKIAIVLGALGVGIGFGLQNLVNNLVSGLVIAFEKPVNLDDEVEVSGNRGVVRSIGFRSSIITTFDGAEVVLPNGDLLNSHLVNWSNGGGKRRSAITIKISHHANLQRIKEDITAILLADDRILNHPEPTVSFNDIDVDALALQLTYWSKQTKQLAEIKSDVLIALNKLFMQSDIQLPYPKHEVFVHRNNTKEKD